MAADRIITYVVRIFVVLVATTAVAHELTPEQKAKLAKQDEFQTAIVKRDAAKVKAMIAAGMPADFNFDEVSRLRTGESPLTMSINRGHLEIAQILLAAGADPNRQNGWGVPPMHYAKSPEAVELLVKHGASINTQSRTGLTALAEAVARGDAERVKLLLANKAQTSQNDLFSIAVERGHAKLVPLLLEGGADPRTPPTRALWLLIESGDEAAARMLIEKGADLNPRNVHGMPLIAAALHRQRWQIVQSLADAGANLRLADGPECAQANRDCHSIYLARVATLHPPTLAHLKARGLDLNLRAENGLTALTALMLDPAYGSVAVFTREQMDRAADVAPRVRTLLDQGADPSIPYRDLTPLMLAIVARPELADMLSDAGGRVDYRHTIRRDEPPSTAYAVSGGGRRIPSASETLIHNNQGLFTGMTAGPLTWVVVNRQPQIAVRLLARERRLEPEDRFLPYFAGLLGQWEVVLAALPYAKDVNAADRAGVTPLMLAADDGRADVVKALLARGARVNERSARDWPPLFETSPAALLSGHSPSKPRLVGGYTPLKAANERGHAEVASLLRAAGGKE